MYSIILRVNLEVSLGMGADADFVLQEAAVAFLMVLLDLSHHTEFGSQLRETLLLSGLSEPGVHIRPLVVLALGGGLQVGGGVAGPLQAKAAIRFFSVCVPV